MNKIIFAAPLLLLTWLLSACTDHELRRALDQAEAQITSDADSALTILQAIDADRLTCSEDAARWGLLSTWALYRKYAAEIPEEPLLRAFNYYRDSKDPLRRAQVYYLHSVVQEDQHRGQAVEWLEDLYRASLSIQETDDHVLAAQIYQRYEDKLYKRHQFPQAIEWGQRFLQEAQLSGNQSEELLAMTNLSLALFYGEVNRISDSLQTDEVLQIAQIGNFEPAFNLLYQALGKARTIGMPRREGKLCGTISSFYTMTQHPDSALHYALMAKDIDEELVATGRSTEPINYLHVADAYRKMNQADSAIHYAMLTLRYPGMVTRRNAANTLYLTYRDQKNDYRQAMEWLRVHNAIADSIQRSNDHEQVSAAQDAVNQEIEKNALQQQKQSAQGWLFWCLLASALIISVVVCAMVQNRFKFQARLKQQEEEFNRLLAERRAPTATTPAATTPTPAATTASPSVSGGSAVPHHPCATTPAATPATTTSATVSGGSAVRHHPSPTAIPAPAPSPTLILTGSTREQLTIAPQTLLFLTSESNYIKVYYLAPDGKVQSKLLRQTMSRLEEQLSPFDFIVRCHRAFFVNLLHVIHATSVPTGLQLTLDASTVTIPVSRTYIADIRNWLKG